MLSEIGFYGNCLKRFDFGVKFFLRRNLKIKFLSVFSEVEIYKKPIPTLDRYEKLNKDWSLNHYHNKVKNGTAKSKKREIITVLTDLESSLDTHLEPDRSTEPISSDHELETLPPSQPSTVNEKRIDVKTRRLLAGKEPPAVVKQPIHVQQPPPTPPFTPSHMEETFENPPTPIPVSYHEESEISTEKRPLLNRLERPEEQKAQMMYYRSGASQVASYNDIRS